MTEDLGRRTHFVGEWRARERRKRRGIIYRVREEGLVAEGAKWWPDSGPLRRNESDFLRRS